MESVMSAVTSMRPRRERRKEARPSELAAAALDLFVERGYAATRRVETQYDGSHTAALTIVLELLIESLRIENGPLDLEQGHLVGRH